MENGRTYLKYSKEYLVSAFLGRYVSLDASKFSDLEDMANSFYDDCVATLGNTAGRKKFRDYCGLTAEALRAYESSL